LPCDKGTTMNEAASLVETAPSSKAVDSPIDPVEYLRRQRGPLSVLCMLLARLDLTDEIERLDPEIRSKAFYGVYTALILDDRLEEADALRDRSDYKYLWEPKVLTKLNFELLGYEVNGRAHRAKARQQFNAVRYDYEKIKRQERNCGYELKLEDRLDAPAVMERMEVEDQEKLRKHKAQMKYDTHRDMLASYLASIQFGDVEGQISDIESIELRSECEFHGHTRAVTNYLTNREGQSGIALLKERIGTASTSKYWWRMNIGTPRRPGKYLGKVLKPAMQEAILEWGAPGSLIAVASGAEALMGVPGVMDAAACTYQAELAAPGSLQYYGSKAYRALRQGTRNAIEALHEKRQGLKPVPVSSYPAVTSA
jgi:hypothetical protein